MAKMFINANGYSLVIVIYRISSIGIISSKCVCVCVCVCVCKREREIERKTVNGWSVYFQLLFTISLRCNTIVNKCGIAFYLFYICNHNHYFNKHKVYTIYIYRYILSVNNYLLTYPSYL